MNSAPDLQRARVSLDGLSLGDAFGQLFFERSPYTTTPEHAAGRPVAVDR